ncbi:MAG: sn-glycerol-3-phosphate ABC transporter ATP-binding protein UgpC [Pseudomonadota bacterium]
MANVELSKVCKSFGSVDVIKGVDLSVQDREFVVFVGPSGCGKSTLLRLIAGLEETTSGDLMIDGERMNDVPPAKRGIAMVFQSYALYPHMTVYQNMAFGLKLARHSKQDIDQKVRDAAKVLQLEPLLERKPKELSGGQRQRVAIGRAIVRNPKVFLFDEPLSNLDAALRVQMRIEITRLHRELDATMIYVTHDQVEAMTLADKICVLNGGLVEQFGTPLELYHHPRNQFVAGFIGSPKMNFVPVDVKSADAKGLEVTLPGDTNLTVPVDGSRVKAGDKLALGFRPEHTRPDPKKGQLSGEVYVVERLGGETYAYVKIPGADMLTVHTDGESRLGVGDTITIELSPNQCHLFERESGLALAQLARNPLADIGRKVPA